MAVQRTNVILRWTLLAESRRLDEWTTVALPTEAAEIGFAFEHDGERWQVTQVVLAGEMDFEQAIATAVALDCAPVYEPELEDSAVARAGAGYLILVLRLAPVRLPVRMEKLRWNSSQRRRSDSRCVSSSDPMYQ